MLKWWLSLKLYKSDSMQNLQSLNLQMHNPQDILKDCVQDIWLAQKPDNRDCLPFKILSDCSASVIFNLAAPLKLARKGDVFNAKNESVIIGPGKDLLTLTFDGPFTTLGIKFTATGGHVFFNTGMDQLTDRFMGGNNGAFIGNEVMYKTLSEQLIVSQPQDLIAHIESHLVQVYQDYQLKAQSRLLKLFNAIEQDSSLGLEELSAVLGVSVRDIQRLFKQYVGVTPNTYLRVNKINQLKDKIANNEFSTLTQLATDSGYFDQAHFIRDFKLFMQETPKRYHTLKQGNQSQGVTQTIRD